mgnify:CR=1 FL=1
MSKKLTSVLVGTVAMLWTLPAQSQTFVTKGADRAIQAQRMWTTQQWQKANAANAKATDKAERLRSQGQSTTISHVVARKSAGNIDLLPYTNALSTNDEFEEFTVIDVNQDGTTWVFGSNFGTYYQYSSTNDADDWLVSPAIKLDGGKEYHFAIEACCQSAVYPEHFEVRASTSALASDLAAGVEVLPTTVVSETDYTLYENYVFKVDEPGYYHIGLHCTSPADLYRLKVRNFVLESLTAPEAVSDFTVVQAPDKLEATVSFKAPVNNVTGNPLEGNISKIEVLRNGEVVSTLTDVVPGSEQTVVDQQPNAGWYAYQVVAYDTNGQDKGVMSETIEVLANSGINVPFYADFSDAKMQELFSIIDNNSDGSTWKYDEDFKAFLYMYNGQNQADDYLVTLPVHLKAGQLYTVKVNANARDNFFHERFEVVMGKETSTDGFNQTLIEATELAKSKAEDFEANFSVEEEGDYYIAVHAISDADRYYLILHEFDILDGPLYTAPAAPGIEVVEAPEGALSATINVTAPTRNIQGDELTGNLTVDLYRDGSFVQRQTDVAPGATVSFNDEVPASATYIYQALAANEFGDGEKAEKVRRFVGIDIPTDVAGFTVSENDNSLHLTWDAVGNIGRNGGYVNPSEVVYNIWNNVLRPSFTGGYVLNHESMLTSVTGETGVDVDINPEEGEQTMKYLSVVASTTTGNADDTYVGWLVGQSYDLPFIEGFKDRDIHYYWLTNGGLMSTEDPVDDDGFALRLVATDLSDGGTIYLQSGKLNIKDAEKPTLTFNVKSSNVSRLYVMGSMDGGMPKMLTNVALTDEYKTVTVPLTSLKSGKYAQFMFMAIYSQAVTFNDEGYVTDLGSNILLDDIRVTDLYDNNLAIDLSAPGKIGVGQSATISATVENKGKLAASNYTVTIKAGEQTLLSETVEEPLAMYAKKSFETEFATTIFDEVGDVNITAEVAYEGEMVPEDNIAESVISVLEPSVSAPTNLTAVVGDDGVTLNWDKPEAVSSDVVEDFENTETFPEFSIGGITSTIHNGSFGDWKLYDGNGYSVYTFPGSVVVPNLGYPSAWLVMNPSSEQLNYDVSADYGAHSGTQYLLSSCPKEPKGSIPAADHWLISPQLSGKAQTISFFVRSLVTMYGAESFEVLASSTNTDIESFKLVTANTCETTEWQEVTVDLPEGTQYFAIRHTSPDIWGMMLDDITYQGPGGEVQAFNIYFEGELVATVTGDVTTYLVDNDKLESGENLPFSVTAVYDNGSESLPATVTVTIVTGIQQIVADGQPVDVYTLDGRLVRQQAKNLDGLRGVFVVNGQKIMVK